MQIEIRACLEENGEVVWVSVCRAEFFAVYWGEPGKMEWVDDFECYTNALRVAKELGEDQAAPVFYWASAGCFQQIDSRI